jgi:uncharacterized RDD family membrane protein YckC
MTPPRVAVDPPPANPYEAPLADVADVDPMDERAPAPNGHRFLAYLVDSTWLAVGLMVVIFGVFIGGMGLLEVLIPDPDAREGAAAAVALLALPAITLTWPMLEVGAQVLLGGSPGHRLLGLELITTDGHELRTRRLVLRSFIKMLVLWTFYILSISVFFDARRRAPWDAVASTRVVKR